MNHILEDAYDEIYYGTQQVLRDLFPSPYQRTPITWTTFPYTLAFCIPLFFLGYLVRRPGTFLVRLLLLPTVVVMALRSYYGYMWTDARMAAFNWARGGIYLGCIGKALEFAFTKEGRFKVGETKLGGQQTRTPDVSKKDDDLNTKDDDSPQRSSLPTPVADSLEIFFAFRGVGWDFGKGIHIPREKKPLERQKFLLATFSSILKCFLVADAMESLIKLVPGVGTPRGGTVFLPSLPPLQRYALSTAVHLASGTCIIAGFRTFYELFTLIAVGLLHQRPASWPPIFDNPFASTSLAEFWAKRWHQVLRRTFLVYGGYPGEAIAGRVGLVLGTFLASGLFHECAALAMRSKWNNGVVAFFVLQGVLVLLERVWRMVTGRRVGGCLGRVWVYFVIVVLGQPCVDSWHRRGLVGGLLIPPAMSPMRQVVFPLAATYLIPVLQSLWTSNS